MPSVSHSEGMPLALSQGLDICLDFFTVCVCVCVCVCVKPQGRLTCSVRPAFIHGGDRHTLLFLIRGGRERDVMFFLKKKRGGCHGGFVRLDGCLMDV